MNPSITTPLILVVEDDKDYIELLERGHKRSNISCHYVCIETAENALTFLKAKDLIPHVILLDYDLPGMSGFEMMEQLKESEWKAIPILMFSIHNRPELINEAYQRGVNAFIPKPEGYTSIIELWHTICSFWGRHVSLPNLT
ncbi:MULTISPECIES: response regulator [unclassified Siphonobacter]|uniref:response regulator n=1 Tax=unclassified Siphonobacter TaxID=2635712 RepID=UPI00277FBA6D|nr:MULTISPECIES: response regulator [unclassified Siphonobacter]MDQ1085480.1 CheY-like chemotaxis protein [Siphonobacter sp. SORGH_AS_1065]MDR6197313.1 CheY-like chemotaxis protein [Siphonobacter sp. SORGH_AS_0500]